MAAALASNAVTGGVAAAAELNFTGGAATFSSPPPPVAAVERRAAASQQLPMLPPAFDAFSFEPASARAPNPTDESPSLLQLAMRVGGTAAVRESAKCMGGGGLPDAVPTPAETPTPGPAVPVLPPPATPTLFMRGKRLFASPDGALAPPIMRARAFKATAFAVAREGDPCLAPPPKGIKSYRPGVHMVEPCELALPDFESLPDAPPDTAEGAKVKKLHEEIGRVLSLLTLPMAASALGYSTSEAESMDPKLIGAELSGALARRGTATMQGARRALVRLHDFALARGIHLVGFSASVGLISAFLSAQPAATMPRQLLLGLRWSATVLKVCPNSHAAILDGFKAKARPGEPKPALCFSLRVMLHLSHIATTYSGTAASYVCAVASGVHLMGQGSLRWADTFGCTFKLAPDAIDGFTRKAKTGPMPWWAELLDARGSSAWMAPLLSSLVTCRRPDFIFRRAAFKGVRRDPESFTAWDLGPAPKSHVIKCLIFILTLPPLNLSYEEAAR